MFGGSHQQNVPASLAFWAALGGGGGGSTTNSTSMLVSFPSGVQDGDLMFLFAAGSCSAGAGCVSSAGFTTAAEGAGGMSASHVFWAGTRIADSEPGGFYTVTFSAAAWMASATVVLRSTTGVKMVANTGVYNTASSYGTVFPSAPLAIATPLDATIYAYGGQDATLAGLNSVDMEFSGLSGQAGSGNASGSCAGAGWGVNVPAPGTPVLVSGTTQVDPVGVALDVVPN